MGLGKLLSFVRRTKNDAKISDVKLDPGGGPNVTAEHFSSPGDDSQPLPGDYVITTPVKRSGGWAVAGYLDPANEQKAQAGDKRIYARDENGATVAEVWLKNDSSMVVENANASVSIAANGNIIINTSGTVDIGGTGGGGLITTQSTCPFTGVPHIDGSTKVRAVKS